MKTNQQQEYAAKPIGVANIGVGTYVHHFNQDNIML